MLDICKAYENQITFGTILNLALLCHCKCKSGGWQNHSQGANKNDQQKDLMRNMKQKAEQSRTGSGLGSVEE